ncbi:mucin-2-like [Saccostrea echinata]|uniref:mucin-2-like n=1 Tax=Saccostrea echinata TaxID=191078 RepID=UPI002A8406F9|nr:mucin-2-like [Saccostrea echinata]
MKIIQASILLFCVSNVASFGILRLLKDIMNSRSRTHFRNRGTPTVNSIDSNNMDVTYWYDDGGSSSSEEGGLHILHRFIDDYDTSTDFETTTSSYSQSATEDDIEDTDEANNSTTTEKPAIATEATSEEKNEVSTIPETTQITMTTTMMALDEKTSNPSTTTTATSEEENEVSPTQETTTTDENQTASTIMTTTIPLKEGTEKSTDGITTSSTMQTTSSREDIRTEAAGSTTAAPPTTTYYITTDTFIEGELSNDDKINKTDLNSTDDLSKIIEEYNDYIDQGPTRGDLPNFRKTTSQNIPTTTQSSGGSGIIDASLFTGSASKININTNSLSISKDNPVDITSGNIGNIPSDVVIQSLNNKLQVNSQKGQRIVLEKTISGQLDDANQRGRNDVISTSPPKPTVFFTPPGSQKNIISEPQKNIFSERVAKIGNDFVILPDFKSGAVLIEPIVSSSNMKTDTISNFDYVPSKTLSYKAIPKNV